MLEQGDLVTLAVVALACFTISGVAQAVTGFGSALVALPLLSFAVAPSYAVVGAILATPFFQMWSWWREREHVDLGLARRLVLWAVLGMPVGLAVLLLISESALKLVIGLMVVVAALLSLVGLRLPPGAAVPRVCGWLSGVLTTSTSLGGPPAVLALDAARLAPRRMRGTLQAYFAVVGVIAAVVFVVAGQVNATSLTIGAAGTLGMLVGWLLGDRVFHRLDARTFRYAVVAMLLASGLAAMFDALR